MGQYVLQGFPHEMSFKTIASLVARSRPYGLGTPESNLDVKDFLNSFFNRSQTASALNFTFRFWWPDVDSGELE